MHSANRPRCCARLSAGQSRAVHRQVILNFYARGACCGRVALAWGRGAHWLGASSHASSVMPCLPGIECAQLPRAPCICPYNALTAGWDRYAAGYGAEQPLALPVGQTGKRSVGQESGETYYVSTCGLALGKSIPGIASGLTVLQRSSMYQRSERTSPGCLRELWHGLRTHV